MYHITYIDKTGTMQKSANSIAKNAGVSADVGEYTVSFFSEDNAKLDALRESLSAWTVAQSGRWMSD